MAEEIGDGAPFDHPARIGREAIERSLDGAGHAGPHLGRLGGVLGVLGRARLQGRPQRGAGAVGCLRHGVLEQLGQELLVGRRRAVLAEQPGARLDELAHLQGCPAVPLVDARGKRNSLAVERALQPLLQRPQRASPAVEVGGDRGRRRRPGRRDETRPARRWRWRA